MQHFITADLHLGDPSAIKYREQFPTIGYHDQYICDTVLCDLGKNDLLTMVGDCVINKLSLEILKKFPCRKRLILGNHDFQKGVHFSDCVGIIDDIRGMYSDKGYWFEHSPTHPDHLRGRRTIHGHLHEVIINDPRYINVSLEAANYKLVLIEDIISGKYKTYKEE